MSERTTGTVLMNLALVGLGLVVLVLLYGLVSRNFAPDAALDAAPRAATDETPAPASAVPSGDIIQVEVRNGCGVDGLAGQMTRFLRSRGFDVVEVGDYTSFDQAETLVIDRVGNLAAAKQVAASLGLPESRVRQEIRPDYYLDASVVIGLDYQTLTAFADER